MDCIPMPPSVDDCPCMPMPPSMLDFPCMDCMPIMNFPCMPMRRFVEDAEYIRNRHVAFLASFHNPSVIFEQISVIYALPRLFVGSFTLVLPFFPTGTLERVGEALMPISRSRLHNLLDRSVVPLSCSSTSHALKPDPLLVLRSGGDRGGRRNGLHPRPHSHQRAPVTRRAHQPGHLRHPCATGWSR